MIKAGVFVLLGAFVFCTSTSFAKTSTAKSVKKNADIAAISGYDLKMELSLNGKIISSPQILAKAGETATITQKTDDQENFIEVTAIDGSILGNDGIMMTFVVGTVDKDGQRRILSKPQIFAKENKPSEITVEQDGSEEILSLSVVAKRKTLQ